MKIENENEIPLLTGKPSDESIVNPFDWITKRGNIEKFTTSKVPQYCILTFPYMNATDYIMKQYEIKRIECYTLKDAPIYAFKYEGMQVCFAEMGMGAPMAGTRLEELIALGAEYILFFGAVGVLKSDITRWTLLLPTRAIRDEGTSYHYQPPSKYTYPSTQLMQTIRNTLQENLLIFKEGVVWTTDAPYRETIQKRRKFMEEGAICVDMEASALFAIAEFRKKQIGAFFYAGDYVGADQWDLRFEGNHLEKLREITSQFVNMSLKTLQKIWYKNTR